ncbi:MAG: cobyrinate a,c-diamide synthase [Pseudomonadota bacterium]
MGQGLIIAAPSSGAGKTTVTLALLRLLSRQGVAVRGAKSGPDYIDPRFHEAACGAPCFNLDAWAMGPERLRHLAAGQGQLVIEGAMGLFDGAPPDGRGSVAELSRVLDLPVVLVVDAGRMAGSAAALVEGFAHHDTRVRVAGVILNNLGSPRHGDMVRRALEPVGLPVLAAMERQRDLTHPERHLGLVQAGERADLDAFLDRAADALEQSLDQVAFSALFASLPKALPAPSRPPPAQVIAVAQDEAFAFSYPHLLRDWRDTGAELRPFSPLANERVPEAGFVFLPGGYPELHAGRIAAADQFIESLKSAAKSTDIYGECGGYMVLGDGLVDADGTRHTMAGLLRLETSFAQRRLHLGYRDLTPLGGAFQGPLKAHEFHYASTLNAEGAALFEARDAEGTTLPPMGLQAGRVCGSFAHIIDAVATRREEA